jgi:hypothetical protein
VVPRSLPAAALAARRRYLIAAHRLMPVAPSRYLIVVPRPLPAAPLVVCHRYLTVVPRPLPEAPLVVCRMYLIAVARPLPAAPRRPLQFTKAGSAATLPQQEEKNSADVQRGGFIPRGDLTGR